MLLCWWPGGPRSARCGKAQWLIVDSIIFGRRTCRRAEQCPSLFKLPRLSGSSSGTVQLEISSRFRPHCCSPISRWTFAQAWLKSRPSAMNWCRLAGLKGSLVYFAGQWTSFFTSGTAKVPSRGQLSALSSQSLVQWHRRRPAVGAHTYRWSVATNTSLKKQQRVESNLRSGLP